MSTPNPPASQSDAIPALFKAYLEDLGRIGGRHETTRAFYLTVVSALFVFLSMAGATGRLMGVRAEAQRVVGIAGFLISLAWREHMRSFRALYAAKLSTLRTIEKDLPVKPFTIESAALLDATADPNGRGKWRYTPLTLVDSMMPIVFALLFGYLLIST
ncbi:MAG: hypothetical protein HY704_04065 [Gemmatimonadetes bacterium]|nr:hypothetical protein [Gemmatimonadota bacterium]